MNCIWYKIGIYTYYTRVLTWCVRSSCARWSRTVWIAAVCLCCRRGYVVLLPYDHLTLGFVWQLAADVQVLGCHVCVWKRRPYTKGVRALQASVRNRRPCVHSCRPVGDTCSMKCDKESSLHVREIRRLDFVLHVDHPGPAPSERRPEFMRK